MNDIWTLAGLWMLRTAVGGGLLLLVTCVLMRWTRQPVRRQRLGDLGLMAALLTALLCAVGPSWLVIAYRGGDRSTGFQPVPDSQLSQPSADWLAGLPRDIQAPELEILDPAAVVPLCAPRNCRKHLTIGSSAPSWP